MKTHLINGIITGAALILSLTPSSLSAKNIPDVVKNCTICHGVDGSGVGPEYPSLARQTDSYIRAELAAYQTRTRHNPGAEYMYGAMSALNEEEIKTVVEYYSKQQPIGAVVDDIQLVARGKEIYLKGLPTKKVKSCVGCHGQMGEGNEDSPRVASLSVHYQTVQFKAFKEGTREEANVMPMIYKNMTEEDQKAVATYLSTLE